MFSLLADLQKERGFPHPSRKKKLLKFKRESTHKERDAAICPMIVWRLGVLVARGLLEEVLG
jgi:hypothetical protein